MSFLLDTAVCSFYLKNDQRVVGKVMLHFGGLLNASVVLVQNLTIVTHNTRDFAHVPGLSMLDWLAP